MTDPIADMLTRIRNAAVVHKKEVTLPFSKLKLAIANILVREGYLVSAEATKDVRPSLVLTMKYVDGQPALQHLKRVSTPGHRHYVKKEDVSRVLNGFGFMILSTSRGIMTDKEARAAKVGGEVLCEIY